MEIIGNQEITKQMITVRKRELDKERKPLLSKLKTLNKRQEKLVDEGESTMLINREIAAVENKLIPIEEELKYYSAKFEPIRLFDVVINHKLLIQILQKTKKLNVSIEKGDNETVIITWNVKGSKGKYTLQNLASFYRNIIYIPELVIQEQ